MILPIEMMMMKMVMTNVELKPKYMLSLRCAEKKKPLFTTI